jgi:hypothetical protein
MPYALWSDDAHGNPKLLAAGLPAMGLYAWSLSYCAHVLSDGYVPARALPALPGVQAAVKVLLKQGLFEPASQGYAIHDYLQYQKSRADVMAERAANAERKRKYAESRKSNGHVRPDSGVRPDV